MRERIRTIHIPSGIGEFSDAEFGAGADCSVYADTGWVTDVVADVIVVTPADYQSYRRNIPSGTHEHFRPTCPMHAVMHAKRYM